MVGGSGISEEGRKARFAQWEKLGLDVVKRDLEHGRFRLIGGPSEVRELAREWVRMKETELSAPTAADIQTVLRDLGAVPPPVAQLLGGGSTELDRLVRAAAPSPQSAARGDTPPPAPAAPVPQQPKASELIILKPTFMGMSIDLKELWRRGSAWYRRPRER